MTTNEIKTGLFFCLTVEDMNLYINSMYDMSRKGKMNFTFSQWFEIDQAVKETEEALAHKVLH